MRPCSATPDGRYRGIPYISDAHSDPRNRPLTIVAFFLFFDGQSSNSIPITIRSIGRGCLKNQTFPALGEHTTRQIGDLVNDDHITPCCDATSPGAISSSALSVSRSHRMSTLFRNRQRYVAILPISRLLDPGKVLDLDSYY